VAHKLFLRTVFTKSYLLSNHSNSEIDNPDQRIAEDIRAFSRTSLSFSVDCSVFDHHSNFIYRRIALDFSNAIDNVIAYAIIGTVITAWIGQRLIGINFTQLKQEADFRYGLVHVRDNAEAIAFFKEKSRIAQLRQRFWDAMRNFDC
jgi:putative ATP-binding cassette transporter